MKTLTKKQIENFKRNVMTSEEMLEQTKQTIIYIVTWDEIVNDKEHKEHLNRFIKNRIEFYKKYHNIDLLTE